MGFVKTLAVVLTFALSSAAALAQSGETPPTLDGAKTVSVAEAKALIDKGAAAFDVRRKAAYVESRLPKAQSITSAQNKDTKEFDPGAFGGDKNAQIVIYGHGTDGWSSVEAVKSAVKAGFKNVNWMRGGFSEWSKNGLPLEQ
jgi:rhodanese-related sulfurtransferase